LSPQRQRQHTLETLLAWLHREAQRQPVLLLVEDLHWLDPSTLELLSLLVEQCAQWCLCLVLTARPEFHPPWAMAAHFTSLTLRRLAPAEVERLATHVVGGKALPPAVLQEVMHKTDGVPLFVEELTKTVLASGLLEEQEDRYALHGPLPPLVIPATLHDALLARLDRLAAAKVVAQLGAVIGRIFTYDLLQAVAPLDTATIQGALAQLVEAEVVAQRGLPPQATYSFKHALIQDTAYQSLLKSTRQQYHHRIAQALEQHLPDMAQRQPELVAQHYTAAGLVAQAIPYWQRAGERALAHSAYQEAVSHLTTALTLLTTLPESRERSQQELTIQMTLGIALWATKGGNAPEVEQLYIRARVLCEQVGESHQLFRILWGLWRAYSNRGDYQTMQALGEQLLDLAQHQHDPDLLLEAHHALWTSLFSSGELSAARVHQEQGLRLYNPQRHRVYTTLYSGHDPGVCGHYRAAPVLWLLGYPDQAGASSQAAIALAQQLAHPFSLIVALYWAAILHHLRREVPLTQKHAEAAMTITADREVLKGGTGSLRGWALAVSGQEEGITQILQSLADDQATGATRDRPYHLALLAEASAQVGQTAEGLDALAEALEIVPQSAVRWWEAELYRLRGELLLLDPGVHLREVEACFQRALDIARRQQAKSLELRAAMSLSRLWQRQGRRAEAHQLLAEIYGWFTEGFDTADLLEAKALLEALT
jgi:predicted ATPase